ncbi:MAG: TrkA family potassium uptake protein, partial [Chloroflexota bacterium]|nr:TrkA family potassium uptake protein [Chloroflexota bacterium]
MAEQVLLAGLGRFGSVLATSLTEAGYDVLAVDRREDRLRPLADTISKVVQGDATSMTLWKELPIQDARIGIVAFSASVESNVLTALLFRKLGIKHIIAKSQGELHTELLHAIGVRTVVEPTRDSALRLAHILGTRITDYLQIKEDFGIGRMVATKLLSGITVHTLHEEHKVTVLVILRKDRVILQPRDEEAVQEGDILLAAGKDRDLHRAAGAAEESESGAT